MHDVHDVNAWLVSVPSVDAARPKRCPSCRAAARPIGAPLAIHGHGTRERQVRGPRAPGLRPSLVVVVVRRYRCLLCRAVMTVLPRDLVAGLLYAASAIAFAVALHGLVGDSAASVRRSVCAWPISGDGATGWPSLRRWITRSSSLWPLVRPPPVDFTLRQRAERIATTIAAYAPPDGKLVERAFAGAGARSVME